uniref:Reverse transcriptase domain-containing protein n=1 Tax=Tanacetum cinerariifolium TaxID=118510 RepID=A0A6L2L820_TANCI|nr:hypothetical protein [Tanacetum cinerariifolium]
MNNNHNQEPPPQNNNGPPPMVRPNGQAPQTMEELCQLSINGRGEPIALIPIQSGHHQSIRDETPRNISSTSTTESPEVVRQLKMMNKNFLEMMRKFQTVKTVDTKCETCGGPRYFTKCLAIGGYTQETAYATTGNYNWGDLKAITTRSGATLVGPSVPPPPPHPSIEVDREPETITD